ncbi:MAG: hypothetical protein ACFFD8_09035 [Candidatus Thorarchaeota archaeon]
MSVHIHTTIPKKAGDTLNKLAGTYGTKSRVLEKALETLLRVEKVGSCDDCAIKALSEEQAKLRESLELVSIRKELLDELLRIALADQTIDNFLKRQKQEIQATIELIQSSISWKAPTNFAEFLSTINQINDITHLYDVTSHRDSDNTVVLRPNVFIRIPELVAFHLALILEGIGIFFDIRIMRKEIIVKMLRKDLATVRRTDPMHLIFNNLEEKFKKIKPELFKEKLALVGPAFLKWAENNLGGSIADLGTVIEDIRLFIKPYDFPEDPHEFLVELFRVGQSMNWITQYNTKQETEDRYRINFQATSPSMASIATVTFALILATKGWKLLRYVTEYDNGTIVVEFVGEGTQDVLGELVELNLFRVINEQFLDSLAVPREVIETLATKVYDSDRKRYEEIYRSTGFRIANAIKMLAKDDEEKEYRLIRSFIEKNIHHTNPTSEFRFIDESNFSIVFKQMEPITITTQQILIESILEALGYEVKVTTFQNLLNVSMKKVGKPLLGPLHRSKVVQMVSDAIAADSVKDALTQVKPTLDELYPLDYPWTIQELGDRLLEMYRELGIQVEIEYFEGGFTLKYRSCPFYKLVSNDQKTWLCTFRKKAIEYILSRVTKTGKGRIKILKSLIQNGTHPCEYAVFLEEFLAKTAT